jgi:CHAT domain-containing protein
MHFKYLIGELLHLTFKLGIYIMQINKLFLVLVYSLMLNGIDSVVTCASAETVQEEAHVNLKNWVLEAEKLREQGDLISAQTKLEAALELVGKAGLDSKDSAAVELALGYNLLLLNKYELSEKHLKSAYQKTVGDNYLHALADHYLANLYLVNSEVELAQQHIKNGINTLKIAGNVELMLSFELMQFGLSKEDADNKAQQLLSIATRINNLPDSNVKSKLALKVAQYALNKEYQNISATLQEELQQQTYKLLNPLATLAGDAGQNRVKAEALGSMALLYRWQSRNDEALDLTEQAVTFAQNTKSKELTAQLEAQKGDLLRLLGDDRRALTAYGHAVDDLFSIRADMPINFADGRSTLVEMIEPIYRNYVDLLFKTYIKGGTDQETQLLTSAVESMEAIKDASLQDFFLGRCSDSTGNMLDMKNLALPGATIVYPILLKDRLELVVKTNEKIYRHTVNASFDEVQNQALLLAKALHNGKDFRAASKKLNEWLFLPIKDDLRRENTNVIVYVPDRTLRAVPFSALYDGKEFVIEHYGVVTLPSLRLLNLVQNHHDIHIANSLLAGLSKPDGASIDQLPKNIVEGISSDKMDRKMLVDELSLPSVEQEINSLRNKDQSTTLINNDFTVSTFNSDIQTGNYDKVHIASHGYFGKNARDSFIMSYDKNISLLDFKSTLEATNLKKQPIELLTLSACKTAEGDDRMLLGFSGLALKSNVLSAVGSLWSIHDEATMEFMKLFYEGMGRSLNKAQSMREAQLSMLKNKKFRHPFFWAPFILIGNWQ